jgi:hypothetical protein
LPRWADTSSTRNIDRCAGARWPLPTALITLAGALLTLTLAGCATQPNPDLYLAQARGYAAELGDREAAQRALSTAAIMDYSGGGEHFRARENLLIQRPANIRVEVMSAAGVALVVATDGGQAAVFNPSKGALMRGSATAATLERYARIPLPPEAAVRMLLGLVPDGSMLALPPASMTLPGPHNDNQTILVYREPGGVTDEIGIGVDRRLASVTEKLADGRVGYRVDYGDWRDAGKGIETPCSITAKFPRTGARVAFIYENPVADPPIPGGAFELAPNGVTKTTSLGMAGAGPEAPRG